MAESGTAADGESIFTATRWTLLEGSLVSIPADISVGVNRSLKTNSHSQKGKNMTTQNDDVEHTTRSEARRDNSQVRELQRRDDLRVLGDQFREFGGEEIARRMIENGGDADTLKSRVLEKMQTVRALPLAEPNADYLPGGRNYRASEQVAWGQGPQEILPKPKYFTGPNAELRAYESGMWLRALHGNDQAGPLVP